MDRRRALAALLIASAAAGPAPPLREARWIAPDARLAALTMQPPECLAPPRGAETAVAIGRAAFRDPLLLGGQAARAGLSCASCHVNGRGNPHFVFPGVSGAPGTADVTHSLLSSLRGDGAFNPKPIPDLVRDPPKVSRDPASPELRAFIRGLVVEEFDGAEPAPAVLDGLAAYVRALGGGACDDGAAEAVSLAAALGDYAGALGAAERALRTGDRLSAMAMLRAARAALRGIDERYAPPGLDGERRLLAEEDGAVSQLLAALRNGGPAEPARRAILARIDAIQKLAAPLAAAQHRSLYSPERLAEAL